MTSTTRSGRTFRMTEEQQAGTPAAGEATGVAEMMRLFLEDRQRREEDLARERERRDSEMREQMQLLRQMVEEGRRGATPVRPTSENDRVKLSKLTETDDVEAYLTTFERMMSVYEVDRSRWAFKLAPQLTGKAQQAYAAMATEDAGDYDKVKAAILKRYNINEETYRQRFRATKKAASESHRDLLTKLKDLSQKWLKNYATSPEKVMDAVVMEQLIDTLSPEVKVWVRERKPGTSEEASQLADDYVQARKQSGGDKGKESFKQPISPGLRRCHNCGKPGHLARDCRAPGSKQPSMTLRNEQRKPSRDDIVCYNCGQRGHISPKCPNNAFFCGTRNKRQGTKCHGVVEGRYVSDILLDTGCSRTLIRRELVPAKKVQEGDVVTIRCAHGDTVLYPLANVKLEVGGREVEVEAAISDTLPMSVLLGTDVAELGELLGLDKTKPIPSEDAFVVITRAQSKQRREEERTQQQRELASGVRATPLTEENERDPEGGETVPQDTLLEQEREQDLSKKPYMSELDDDMFLSFQEKERLTRSQKQEAKKQYARETEPETDKELGRHALDMSSEELAELQQSDDSLIAVRKASEGKPNTAGGGFFKRDGLIYRQWTPPGHDSETAVEQLVLPKTCRSTILHLAHTIPLAGHMGRDKTAQRILQRFYWPTVYKDTADYCRSCAECQKSRQQKVKRAPLMPLPIIGEPFARIAMDIVGPLPRSRAGHRFILVICDYATRYPEAVPLRSIDAEHVAEELIKFFARVGIPKEILTDQGSNFVSQLLTEVYRLLHIHPIRTTPYHPQTDGLVERFNKTLKSMLRRATCDVGKDWDKLLPYLLFAYREVPQSSTGFSPFELVYGRAVRGPLDVLREVWETDHRSNESVVSHVLSMREKLAHMTCLVEKNLSEAQKQQKRWYDRKAVERSFENGDQVLVLLPSDTSKLLARWQGPYKVLRRVGKVDYLVDMHDTRKRKRILHVNMLQRWYSPSVTDSFSAEDIADDWEENDVPVWKEGASDQQPKIGTQLNNCQRNELEQLLSEFRSTLQNRPGHTNIVEHRISIGTARPIKLPPYRIPHAYRETVQKEVHEMLNDGIIERSKSEWAAPIVLIKKKDGSLRLCVDYRRMNAVTQTDAYPMPRIDDLIDRLGKGKYITTLDLTRGYWQVPVAEEDQHKTAFATPFGLYQFRVMPFGLCGAPATFQRMMDHMLEGLEDFTAAYLDDLVIYSETWEDHLRHVRSVLRTLKEAGLTAKPQKCQFAMSRCTYLGHTVGGGKVSPEMDKLQAVQDFPIPTTKKEVRSFLGLTGYYRRFMPDYAANAVPLTELTRKCAPNKVQWNNTCQDAFEKLKKLLCSQPVLWSPNFSKEFILQTDASDYGIGAVLSQFDAEGIDHPVAYYSRKLLPREQRYSTVEKECLAIKLATHAFRVYLLGRKFTIQTDHRALQWLDRLKENNSRLTRWSLALQSFKFEVQHRAGKANANADALSRLIM